MKPVRFHPALEAEVQEAARFYENLGGGLGDDLLGLIEQTTRDIQRAPTRCQLVEGNVRKRRLPRFPYFLIFEDRDDCIRIVTLIAQPAQTRLLDRSPVAG